MSYAYATEKPKTFTEDGQKMFLEIRDRAQRLVKSSGAATMGNIISGTTGDSWQMMACVDRLAELGELHEIPNPVAGAGQYRIFFAAPASC